MIYQKVRKTGNSLVVTIPKDEAERLNISEGDMVALQVQKAEIRPILSDELQVAADAAIARHKEGLDYLAGR